MLIHFCPRLLTPAGFDLPCELIDIRIKEFDLHLLGGRDVVARHPLPDKRYHVACRKAGCKDVGKLDTHFGGLQIGLTRQRPGRGQLRLRRS